MAAQPAGSPTGGRPAGSGLISTAAGPAERRGRRRRPQARRETLAAYAFLSPWLVGALVFTLGPMVASLVLSFTSYDLINAPRWVGVDNYVQAAGDPKVRIAILNTLSYTILHVPLSIVAALALAMLLTQVPRRSAGVFRTLFYLPSITPPVAVGVLFLLLLNGQVGLVNAVLSRFGVDGPNWTTDPAWVVPGIVVMGLWTLGTTTIIFYAALLNVPTELYEAARIDGAGAWARFRHVSLPMISGAIFFAVIVNTIASLQIFTEVYTMFFGTQATAAGDSALFYVIYLFQQGFQFLHMGYASALAWVLFLVVLVITLVQLKLGDRFVFYQGDQR